MRSAERTIRYSKFAGLDKLSDPVAFSSGEGAIKLSVADNMNLTRAFKPELRDGYSLWKSGEFTSLWGNADVCYAVENGDLFELSETGEKTGLRNGVGNTPMSFVDTKDGFVYYCNGVVNGKIRSSVSYALGAPSDQFKITLPVGDFMSFASPHLLVVKGNAIFVSDPVNKDVYHRVHGFKLFESNVRMVAVVGTTWFVSDEKAVWVMRKADNPLQIPTPIFRKDKVMNYPAIPGNVSTLLYNITASNRFYPECVAWLYELGVCVGGEDGSVVELTEDKYNIPSVPLGGAICYRQVGDLNLLISIFKSADYVSLG